MANVNEIRPGAPIVVTLGGKERKLIFDMNALAELEGLYGTIEKAMTVLEKGRLTDVRALLWAGICHEEVIRDEITKDVIGYNIRPYDVGAMIKTAAEIPELANQIFAAMSKDLALEVADENTTAGTELKKQ